MITETILSIEETEFFTDPDTTKRWRRSYDGYRIVTDQQAILVGIEDSQHCCENWGHVTSEDDLQSYVGAQLNNIRITDTSLNAVIDEAVGDLSYEGSCMFVTFGTSKGDFQFVAYNDHNGYYGHKAVLVSNQVTESEIL